MKKTPVSPEPPDRVDPEKPIGVIHRNAFRHGWAEGYRAASEVPHQLWQAIQTEAYGNPWVTPKRPRICVVSARYGGGYEGGRFVAIPVEYLDSAAFGEDCACSEWWQVHEREVGAGATPDEALLNWYEKRRQG